jgi:hypothetical protein
VFFGEGQGNSEYKSPKFKAALKTVLDEHITKAAFVTAINAHITKRGV